MSETQLDQYSAINHHQSLQLLGQQADILALQATGARLPTVLRAVVEALERLIPTSRCSILLLDNESRTLIHGAAPRLPSAYSAAIDGMAIGRYAGSCGTAAYLGTAVVAIDISTDRRWRAFRRIALPFGLRSCWSSPIIAGDGAVLGTFAVYHDNPHEPTEQETQLVARFRHLAAVAIEQARLFRALADSEERFRRAFEDNAVGMALLDLTGRFTMVNRALCDMVGYRESDLVTTDFRTITRPEDVAASSAAFDALAAGNNDNVQLEKCYRRRDGTDIAVVMTASVVRAEDGTPRYISTNIVDVTARIAAEEERRSRYVAEAGRLAAEHASHAKSEFLAAMSHELRTPLSAIVGFAELLRTLDLPEQRRHAAAHTIGESAGHILSIVDDALDIATIESGAMSLDIVDLTVADVLGDAISVIEPLAAERNIRLRVIEAADLRVCADRRRMLQVLLNLLSNAVKYNHRHGLVELSIRRIGSDAAITVRDTGPGIDAELQDRLFAPFDRLGNSHSDEMGSGLGLAVSQQLVDAMGGTLTIRSESGRGTLAEVRLPAARVLR